MSTGSAQRKKKHCQYSLVSVKDYFAYAEAGFALRSISDHIFTCTLEVLTDAPSLLQVCVANLQCYTLHIGKLESDEHM